MLELVIALPLVLAAFVALALRTGRAAGYIALAASVLSLALALYAVSGNPGPQDLAWFSVAGFTFSIETALSQLNVLLLLLVAVMTPLVLAYSIGFMGVPSEQGRYYFEMCTFAASMMIFSMSAGFLTMFVGWELLGITSYLLIGFWYWNEKAPGAARKAVTTVLIGDVLMLAALALIWNAYGTFNFASILNAGASATAGLALVLIALAVFTKSAQFPFHEWLPDAMEGPTPVSAFLHSSTMVKAGVFLLAVLLPLFAEYSMLWVLVAVGAVSALLGASNALAESRIKRVLAYSTIEDLGLMTVALGFGALAAAMLLFAVQTFYKALLFMCAGAIMRANDNEENIYQLRSFAASKPLLIAAVIGAASIAGIFPLAGFFGKVGVEAASRQNLLVYGILMLVSLASSLYIFRWLFVPLRPGARSVLKGSYNALPKSMLAPVYILAALAVSSALAYAYLPAFLGGRLGADIFDAVLESILVLAGLGWAYLLYSGARSDALALHKRLYAVLRNGNAVNALYFGAAKSALAVSAAVRAADSSAYSFVRRTAGAVSGMGSLLRLLVSGRADAYATAFAIGVLAIIVLFMVLH